MTKSKKFVLSFSGGKDGMLALYRLIRQGHRPAALLTTYHTGEERSWFHGIPAPLLEAVADSLGIPLVLTPCGPQDDYAQVFSQKLLDLKAEGATACAFGDIDLQGHLDWCRNLCASVGMECIHPLWGEPREALVREFIESGFCAVIKTVRLSELDASYLGRELTWPLAERIRAAGADLCGENGEYHTLVVDGPLFKGRVAYISAGMVQTETHAFLDLRPAGEKD